MKTKCPCNAIVELDLERVEIFIKAQGVYITRCNSCQATLQLTRKELEALKRLTPPPLKEIDRN